MTTLPTAELILSKLPLIITLWTAVTLCWGIYINGTFINMMSYADRFKNGRRITDVYNTWFTAAVNALLVMFLVTEHLVVQYADAIIVINVFFDAFLVVATITACRWWQSTRHTPTPSPSTPSP